MRRGLIVAGLLLLAAGLVLGFVPQSARGTGCGSVFHASDEATVGDLVSSFDGESGSAQASCDDRRALYKPVVWVLVILGAGAVIAATFVPDRK